MTQHVPPQQRLLRPSGHAKPDSVALECEPRRFDDGNLQRGVRAASIPADRAATRKTKGMRSSPLVFRWEPFHKISKELMPLFKRHWQEIALDQEFVPLDPDWDLYYAMEVAGKLHILTARKEVTTNKTMPTDLVGYIFNLVGGHLHYNSTKFAHTEMFWLAPEFRKGWWPVKMFKENLAGLKEREVEVSTINFKLHFANARVGKLLARLGYTATDIVMRKVL